MSGIGDGVEAYVAAVFAALAVARYLQACTGWTIKRPVRIYGPCRQVTVTIAGQQITAQLRLDPERQPSLMTAPMGRSQD